MSYGMRFYHIKSIAVARTSCVRICDLMRFRDVTIVHVKVTFVSGKARCLIE
jgi:hypothetical protein